MRARDLATEQPAKLTGTELCEKNMSMEQKDVLNLLGAAPKLRSLVMRWARQTARGEKLPATFSVADLGMKFFHEATRLPIAA